jgi:hypothetical protein
MQDIFRGTGGVFGFTAESTGAILPPKYGTWSAFKTRLHRGGAQPVNAAKCLTSRSRFPLTDAHVPITESDLR